MRSAKQPASGSGGERPAKVEHEGDRDEDEPEQRDLEGRMGGVRVDELRQEGEEEEGDLRVEGVDEDALREDAPEPEVAATRRLRFGVCAPGKKRPEP